MSSFFDLAFDNSFFGDGVAERVDNPCANADDGTADTLNLCSDSEEEVRSILSVDGTEDETELDGIKVSVQQTASSTEVVENKPKTIGDLAVEETLVDGNDPEDRGASDVDSRDKTDLKPDVEGPHQAPVVLLLRQSLNSANKKSVVTIEKYLNLADHIEIGRRMSKEPDTNNGLFLDRLISRKHALIYWENNKVIIEDLNSLHGTFVNMTEVTEPTQLFNGDLIQFGQSTDENRLRVRILDDEQPRAISTGTVTADDGVVKEEVTNAMPMTTRKRPFEEALKETARKVDVLSSSFERRVRRSMTRTSIATSVLGGVMGGLGVGAAIIGLANCGKQ